MPTIAEILRSKITKDGKSKTYIASKLGVSEKTIENYMNGKREPDMDRLVLLSELLEFSLSELSEQSVPRNTHSEHAQNVADKQPVSKEELYERLLAEKEISRKRAEAKEDALLKIIEQNLTALLVSSSKNQELLLKIWDEQTSDDQVIMDNQDVAAKNPKGTSSGKSDSYQIKLATARKEAQQKTGKGKHVKANR